jgi:hypothetical protein
VHPGPEVGEAGPRQRTVAPFNPNPGCAAPLLISAAFQ